jgi:hypothetical protein
LCCLELFLALCGDTHGLGALQLYFYLPSVDYSVHSHSFYVTSSLFHSIRSFVHLSSLSSHFTRLQTYYSSYLSSARLPLSQVSSLKGQLVEAKEKYGDVVTAGTERQDAEMRSASLKYNLYTMTRTAALLSSHLVSLYSTVLCYFVLYYTVL